MPMQILHANSYWFKLFFFYFFFSILLYFLFILSKLCWLIKPDEKWPDSRFFFSGNACASIFMMEKNEVSS